MNYLANLVPVDPFEEIKQEFKASSRKCEELLSYLNYNLVGRRLTNGRNLDTMFHDLYFDIHNLNDIVQQMTEEENTITLVISLVNVLADKPRELVLFNKLIEDRMSLRE